MLFERGKSIKETVLVEDVVYYLDTRGGYCLLP